MVFKNVTCGESLAARSASIGSLIGVSALMLHSSCIVGEAAPTVLAGKWALSGVLTHVALKLRGGAKAFVTYSSRKVNQMVYSYL